MKMLIAPLLGLLVLAAPAAAFAHDGHGHHLGGARFATVQHGMTLSRHSGNGDVGRFVKQDGVKQNGVKHDGVKHVGLGVFEKATGTGTSFGATTATASGSIAGNPLATGTFSATLATDWTKAASNGHGGSCAPATGTLSLTDSASSANTLSTSLAGKVCSVTPADPSKAAYVFFGAATAASAGGTLAGTTGTGKVLLAEKTDGTVTGFAFAGFHGERESQLALFAKGDAAKNGCDGH